MLKDLFFDLKLTCNACGREIFEGYFCKDCTEKMELNTKFCVKCGRSVLNDAGVCSYCYGNPIHFDKARSVYGYKAPVSGLIKSLKFNGKKYLAEIFGEILSPYVIRDFADADVITCVPMHEKDFKKRGYNQTELIARKTADVTGYSFDMLVEKFKRTKKQIKLGKKERLNNLKSVFKVIDKKKVFHKRILVIDDVMTTGATAEAISEKLFDAGAEKIYFLTVASVGEKELKKDKKLSFFAKVFKKKCLHKNKNSVK